MGPPGREPPRSVPPLPRDQQRIVRSGAPSIDRGHFAWAKLALRLGAGSTVPRAGFSPTLMRGGSPNAGLDALTAVGAPTHRTRTARRLLRPRLRLRPRFLAGEEGSTPWTRPPFTSRPPRGGPGLTTGGEASMRPTVIAYRLLQPLKERRTSTTERASVFAARRGPQPSSRFVAVVTRPSRGTRPTDREPRALVRPPRDRFFP